MGTKNQTEYEIDRASATLKDTEDLDVVRDGRSFFVSYSLTFRVPQNRFVFSILALWMVIQIVLD